MANCKLCGRELSFLERFDGVCGPCFKQRIEDRQQTADELIATESEAVAARAEADAADVLAASSVTVSTEALLADQSAERLGIVSANCIYGGHLGKDMVSAWHDTFGGRSSSLERLFSQARDTALQELKIAALKLGADAVIAVQLSHQELAGGGKSMVMVTATGTAVRLNPPA